MAKEQNFISPIYSYITLVGKGKSGTQAKLYKTLDKLASKSKDSTHNRIKPLRITLKKL